MSIVIKKLDKIEDKVDKLDGRLDSAEKVAVKQEANLAEHMRRTELLENDLKPVKKHVAMVNGGLKLLGIISLIIGIIAGLMKIFNF